MPRSTQYTRAEMRDEGDRPPLLPPLPEFPQGPQMTPEMLMAALGIGATKTIVHDDDISYHHGSAILLPDKMPLERGVEVLNAKIREQEEEHTFTRIFDYRPPDGANAAANVLHRMFGLVVGKKQKLPFGQERPPGYMTIDISHNKTRDVPWNLIEIPALKGAEILLTASEGEFGPVFAVQVKSPKKHKQKIEELFKEIKRELDTNSIYRGQAVQGAHELKFLNLGGFDPNRIIFSDEVTATLDAALFSVLRHPHTVKAAGMKLRRAVMLYGPFGTGKSSIGQITAQLAVDNGWTYLAAKAGRDGLRAVMETAKLYQRAVVFVEDIDAHTPRVKDKDAVSELLDVFDGIAAKDTEIILVCTTNHVETVPAGMMRPGRMDYVVEVSGLDLSAAEKLIRANIPEDLIDADVDFEAVYDEMTDFQPAWVKAAVDRAQSFAISRTGGALTYAITTEDLVAAARSLHAQLELMRKATEGADSPDLDDVFREMMRAANHDVEMLDYDGDHMGRLNVKS